MELQTPSKKSKKSAKQTTGVKVNSISAKTEKQREFLHNFNKFQVLSLIGSAGTGKSFLALHQAFTAIETGKYDKVYILRSAVPTRNIGFLPGSKKEKMTDYEIAYSNLCTELYGRGDAYSILKQKKFIEFESTSYLRGMTFDNCIVILDEAQNCSRGELYTVITRMGENTKLLMCGDTRQDDLTSERYKEESGLDWVLGKLNLLSHHHKSIEFTSDDIVRSGFIKDFIKVVEL